MNLGYNLDDYAKNIIKLVQASQGVRKIEVKELPSDWADDPTVTVITDGDRAWVRKLFEESPF